MTFCLICNKSACLWDCYGDELKAKGREFYARLRNNKQVRYHLYRYYISIRHGSLGRGVRVKIPDCVESEIRKLYPNEGGNGYVGFQPN